MYTIQNGVEIGKLQVFCKRAANPYVWQQIIICVVQTQIKSQHTKLIEYYRIVYTYEAITLATCHNVFQAVFQNVFQDVVQEIIREVFEEIFQEIFHSVFQEVFQNVFEEVFQLQHQFELQIYTPSKMR